MSVLATGSAQTQGGPLLIWGNERPGQGRMVLISERQEGSTKAAETRLWCESMRDIVLMRQTVSETTDMLLARCRTPHCSILGA